MLPTLALRKRAVTSIVNKVRANVNYYLAAADVQQWKRTYGKFLRAAS